LPGDFLQLLDGLDREVFFGPIIYGALGSNVLWIGEKRRPEDLRLKNTAGETGREETVELCFCGERTEGLAVESYIYGGAAEREDMSMNPLKG